MNEHNADSEPPGVNSPEDVRRRDLVQWLIHQAACRAPVSLAERLEEEWLADLAARTSLLSRLRFALGCCWATRVIASEQCLVALAAPATGTPSRWHHSDGEPGLFARHSVTVISVLAFHLAIVGVLLLGIGGKIKHLTPAPLEIHELADVERPPPTVDRPRLERPHSAFVIPMPESPRLPDSADERRTSAPTGQAAPQATGGATASEHLVSRVNGGPGAGFPNTDDYYPSVSRFRAEQGVATVHVCVDPRGQLTAEPTVVESSGFPRLDASALRLARAGSGHYRASTEDGSPVNSCYAFRVHFQLAN